MLDDYVKAIHLIIIIKNTENNLLSLITYLYNQYEIYVDTVNVEHVHRFDSILNISGIVHHVVTNGFVHVHVQ